MPIAATPVDTAPLRGLDPCVHCGFCLQACPTFLATGDEADSPRGRIVLMQALSHGTLEADDPDLIRHLDRCLGCRACETACPSGVSYGPALEQTRHVIRRVRRLRADGALALAVMADPMLRQVALGISRLVRPLARILSSGSLLGFGMGMLAATRPTGPTRQTITRSTSRRRSNNGSDTSKQEHVTIFRGCVMDGMFDHVNEATIRVMEFNGCNHTETLGQGCCGALHAHAGLMDDARALARTNIAAFKSAGSATVIINSAGCGSALKEYGDWFRNEPESSDAAAFSKRVKDVTELLAEQGPRHGAPLKLKVAYDPPCHLAHAQRVREAPLEVLRAIPELEIVEHQRADECCGSAGIYSLLERRMSRQILAPKIESLLNVQPDVVATGNPGCIMQIGAGLRAAGAGQVRVMHPVELLDRSYQELNDRP